MDESWDLGLVQKGMDDLGIRNLQMKMEKMEGCIQFESERGRVCAKKTDRQRERESEGGREEERGREP